MTKANLAPHEERNEMLADLMAISHMAGIAEDLVTAAVENWSGDQVGVLQITRTEIERLEFAVNDAASRAASAYQRWRDAPLPPAVTVPRERIDDRVGDPLAVHIGRLESHNEIHELFELFVDIEKMVALHFDHPRYAGDGPAVEVLQQLASFINWQIDTLHEKAKDTPPSSRMAGEKRALTMIAYEVSNRSFAAEIIEAAQTALAELDRMGFAADDRTLEDAAP